LRSTLSLLGAPLCALALVAVAAPASALAGPSSARMVTAINAARAHHGLRPLHVAAPIAHASTAYARRLASNGRFKHARPARIGHYRVDAEILGLAPGKGGMTTGIVRAWLKSRVHRPILLSRRYDHVGVGVARGRMNGRTSVFWVVRFGRR
jgi:uncharacterized protein YkwD